jgi:hypothetical protein
MCVYVCVYIMCLYVYMVYVNVCLCIYIWYENTIYENRAVHLDQLAQFLVFVSFEAPQVCIYACMHIMCLYVYMVYVKVCVYIYIYIWYENTVYENRAVHLDQLVQLLVSVSLEAPHVCMCVYMCVYIMCLYVYMVYVKVCVYIYIWYENTVYENRAVHLNQLAQFLVSVSLEAPQVCMYVYVYVCMKIFLCVGMHNVCMCVCIYIYIYAYIHAYVRHTVAHVACIK